MTTRQAKPRRRALRPRWLGARKRTRGQAMTETALLTVLIIGWGGVLTYFFPDAFAALQIYMDGFYYVFSMPIP